MAHLVSMCIRKPIVAGRYMHDNGVGHVIRKRSKRKIRVSKATDELEEYFGLPNEFFHNLQMEDDWSLVVKLHALLETALNVLLAEELGHPEIEESFAKVQMGARNNGKLSFIFALKLLGSHEVLFLETLGELRNKFAHNVSNTQAPLKSVIGTMSKKKQKHCWKALGMGATVQFHGREYPASELAQNQPEAAVWISSSHILKMIHLRMIGAKMKNELVAKKIAEHFAEHGPTRLREGVASFGDVR